MQKIKDILYNSCFIFPLEEDSVSDIELGIIDSRHGLEIFEIERQFLLKLLALGLLNIKLKEMPCGDFGSASPIKVESFEVHEVLNSILCIRKSLSSKISHQIIDKIVYKAKRALKNNLPFWVSL